MAYFIYRGTNSAQQIVSGVVQAASWQLAAQAVTDQGLNLVDLQEQRPNIAQRFQRLFRRVSLRDVTIFSRQLSVVVSATIPLVQGLRLLIGQTTRPALRIILQEVATDVEGGAKLSVALARYPDVFSVFYVNIIKAGETSGKLDEVLAYLADQQEKDYDLVSKIRGAMIYPAFILVGLVIVGSLMMIIVLPQLTAILSESSVALPLSTRILIWISTILVNYWWLLGGIVLALLIGGRWLISQPRGRFSWDRFLLRLPVFGQLLQAVVLVRLMRSLYTLLTGGVPLARSLEIAASVSGNAVYQHLILETAREVESGNPIATVFLQHPEVPAMVTQMLNLGERTGRLEDVLDRISTFYNREATNMVANLVTLMEPLVMLFLGAAVGVMVAAIILPIYNLAGSL